MKRIVFLVLLFASTYVFSQVNYSLQASLGYNEALLKNSEVSVQSWGGMNFQSSVNAMVGVSKHMSLGIGIGYNFFKYGVPDCIFYPKKYNLLSINVFNKIALKNFSLEFGLENKLNFKALEPTVSLLPPYKFYFAQVYIAPAVELGKFYLPIKFYTSVSPVGYDVISSDPSVSNYFESFLYGVNLGFGYRF